MIHSEHACQRFWPGSGTLVTFDCVAQIACYIAYLYSSGVGALQRGSSYRRWGVGDDGMWRAVSTTGIHHVLERAALESDSAILRRAGENAAVVR